MFFILIRKFHTSSLTPAHAPSLFNLKFVDLIRLLTMYLVLALTFLTFLSESMYDLIFNHPSHATHKYLQEVILWTENLVHTNGLSVKMRAPESISLRQINQKNCDTQLQSFSRVVGTDSVYRSRRWENIINFLRLLISVLTNTISVIFFFNRKKKHTPWEKRAAKSKVTFQARHPHSFQFPLRYFLGLFFS